MILYHGSNVIIENIDLTRSKPHKDFGKGFYLSSDEEQAFHMAALKSAILGGEPIVTRYEFDETYLHGTDLSVKIFSSYTEEWAQFVFANRNSKNGNAVFQYDIVYGPIANDKVGLQIKKLEDKSIDIQEFLHRLKYMKGITFQYYFGTEKSIHLLRRL